MTARIRSIRFKPHVKRFPGVRLQRLVCEDHYWQTAIFVSIGWPNWRRQG